MMKTGLDRVESSLFASNMKTHNIQKTVSSVQLYSREAGELAHSDRKDYKQDQESFNTNICKLIVKWEEIQEGDQDRGEGKEKDSWIRRRTSEEFQTRRNIFETASSGSSLSLNTHFHSTSPRGLISNLSNAHSLPSSSQNTHFIERDSFSTLRVWGRSLLAEASTNRKQGRIVEEYLPRITKKLGPNWR